MSDKLTFDLDHYSLMNLQESYRDDEGKMKKPMPTGPNGSVLTDLGLK